MAVHDFSTYDLRKDLTVLSVTLSHKQTNGPSSHRVYYFLSVAECYLSPSITCTLVMHLLQSGISAYRYQKGHFPLPLLKVYFLLYHQLHATEAEVAWIA